MGDYAADIMHSIACLQMPVIVASGPKTCMERGKKVLYRMHKPENVGQVYNQTREVHPKSLEIILQKQRIHFKAIFKKLLQVAILEGVSGTKSQVLFRELWTPENLIFLAVRSTNFLGNNLSTTPRQ